MDYRAHGVPMLGRSRILVSVHSVDKAIVLVWDPIFKLSEDLFLPLNSHDNLTVDILDVHIFSASMDSSIGSHQ